MTDKKISELTSITGANVSDANDVLPIVDTSVATTKKITRAELFKSVSSVDINGGTIDNTVIGGSAPAAISGTTGTFSGDVSIADKIVHTGDTNTALRFPAADTVTVETSGSESMRITSSGDVGIGATLPQNRVTISGATPYLSLLNTTTGTTASPSFGGIKFYGFSETANGLVASVDGGNTQNNNFGGILRFSTQADGGGGLVEHMHITSSGNVGIGTTSPAGILQLKAANPDFYITSDNTGQSQIYFGGTTTPTKGRVQYSDNSDFMAFWTNSSQRMTIDSNGNVLIGGTTAGTASAGNLVLVNGTAPTGNVTDGITLYAEDVSASSELKVRDEAGNVTTLSPHNFDLIPEGPSEDMAWSYYSERDGKRINVDMLKAIRLLEQITGEKLVHMA